MKLETWKELLTAIGQSPKATKLKVTVPLATETLSDKQKFSIVLGCSDDPFGIDGDELVNLDEATWFSQIKRTQSEIATGRIGPNAFCQGLEETDQPVRVVAKIAGEEYRSGPILFIDNHPLGAFVDVIGAIEVSCPKGDPKNENVFSSVVKLPQEGVFKAVIRLRDGVCVRGILGNGISHSSEGEDENISFEEVGSQVEFSLRSDDSCTYQVQFLENATIKTLTLHVQALVMRLVSQRVILMHWSSATKSDEKAFQR